MRKITCGRCGREIGRLIQVEKREEELLQIGNLVVLNLEATCVHCGETFYYSVNQKRLERLIRRGLKHKETQTAWDKKVDRDQLIIGLRKEKRTWKEIAEIADCSVSTCIRVWKAQDNFED